MTKQEEAFINRLHKDEIIILQSLLGNSKEVSQYLDKILQSEENSVTAIELTKDIPITYLPVLSVNLDYYKYGTLESIYDYLSRNQIQKKQIRNLGSAKIGVLDCATEFVLNHLNDRIEWCKKNDKVIISGTLLLDEDLQEKENLVIEQIPDIYQFLSRFGTDYIFSGSRKTCYLEYLCSETDLDKQAKLVEILARYSSLEDLQDYNIMSFQKFIKQ